MEKNFVSNGNKLIAEFMDYNWDIEIDGELCILDNSFSQTIETIKYHVSWDWLMPVVEKIESLGYNTSFKTNYVRINPKENCSYYNYISMVCFNSEGWYLNHPYVSYDDNPDFAPIERGENQLTKLEAIYRVVIEFIKWYNEQNK